MIRKLFGFLFRGLFGFSKTASRTFWFGIALTLIFWGSFAYLGLSNLETMVVKNLIWVLAFAIIIRPHLNAERNIALPIALALLLAMGGLTTFWWVVPVGYFVARLMKATGKWWANSWLRGQYVNSTTYSLLSPHIHRFFDWAWPVEQATEVSVAADSSTGDALSSVGPGIGQGLPVAKDRVVDLEARAASNSEEPGSQNSAHVQA